MVINKELINSEAKNFPLQALQPLDKISVPQLFRKGQTIFYSGHMPYGLFVLISGEIKLKYDNKQIEIISSPSIIGISAFLKKSPYSATASATSESKIYFLSYTILKEKGYSLSVLEKFIKNQQV